MRVRTRRFTKAEHTVLSGIPMSTQPQRTHEDQALAGQPGVRHPGLRGQGFRKVPVTLATQRGQNRLALARPQCQKVARACHLVLTRPETEPSMRFLSVGFRPLLAVRPLPSASSCFRISSGHNRYFYRGLAPHKFMPISGVHHAPAPDGFAAGEARSRWAASHAYGNSKANTCGA
jgi:hypothetical protein